MHNNPYIKARIKRGTAVKLGISLVFILILVFTVPGAELLAAIKQANPLWVGASMLVTFAMLLTSCLKWHYILKVQGHPVAYKQLLKYYLVGYYFSNLLPTNVGGDVVRGAYTGKRIGSTSAGMVSVFLERVTGLILLLLLAILGPLLVPDLIKHPAVLVPVGFALALMVFLVIMLTLKDPVGLARKIIPFKFLEPIYRACDAFHTKLFDALRTLQKNPRAYGPIALYTLIFYALTWCNIYSSFRAFGTLVDFNAIVAITPIVMVVAMLPLAPLGGLGLQEFSYSFYFGLVGIPSASVLAMALLIRLKLIILAIVGMIFHTIDAPDE